MTIATIFETEGSFIGKSIPNLVLSNYRTRESEGTGDALFLDLTFERVRFSTVERVESISPAKGSDVDKSAAKSKDKSSVTAKTPSEEEAPKKERVWAKEIIGGL